MKTKISCILLLGFCLSLVGSSFGEIFIGNADFEDIPIDEGSYTYNISPWLYDNAAGDWPAWISYNYYDADRYPPGEPQPVTQIIYPTYCIVYQPLSATYEDGGIYNYSIDVAIWEDTDVWEIFLYDATAGDHLTPLISRASTDAGEEPLSEYCVWFNKSLTFVASPSEADHKIGVGFSGGYYTIFDNVVLEVPAGASLPDPYDSEINVILDKTLSWHAGRDPNHAAQPNPAITQHMLYMSSGSPTDPNVSYVTSIPATGDTAEYTPDVELEWEATYYWRVDERLESDANVITGDVWMFKTVGTYPAIDENTPADAKVDAGDDAVFTVIAFNPFTSSGDDLTFQWYKVGEPDVELSDGVHYSGTQTASLTVLDTQVADNDEGQYYCVVTNTAGNTESNTSRSATLTIKKIIGWWKLDEISGTIASDSTGLGNDGTLTGNPVWKPSEGINGGAIDLDGVGDAVEIAEEFGLTSVNNITYTAWINGWKEVDWAGIVYSREAACGMHFGANNTLHYTWNNNSGSTYSWEGGPVIPQDEWAFVALTIEPDKATLYVYSTSNGLQSGVHEMSHFPQTTSGIKLGWDPLDETRYFNGMIDDARIYNYALGPLEIANVILEVKSDASFCASYPAMDISGPDGEPDCAVDIFDFAMMASQWMQCNLVPDCMQ
jgi:hypothetical protein